MYSVTKRFGGFPCAHRQHAHDGHCAHVHGYSIWFDVVFKAPDLDGNGFVVDFGKLKPVRKYLTETYDHTLLINKDDPLYDQFEKLEKAGGCRLRVLDNVSMENRAHDLFKYCLTLDLPVTSVTCWENEKNAGAYHAAS